VAVSAIVAARARRVSAVIGWYPLARCRPRVITAEHTANLVVERHATPLTRTGESLGDRLSNLPVT